MENPAPWRVLEAPAGSAPGPAPEAAQQGLGLANRTAIVAALVGAVAIASAAGALAITGANQSVDFPGGSALQTSGGPNGTTEIVVEVSGAVQNPGVYRLPATARVADAIEVAGGYGPRVDALRAAAALDLAGHLTDGATVSVPSRDDPEPAASSAGGGGAATGLVNLNTASASELEALPGIGPVTAQKIIAARAERPFASVSELRERGLVGEKTFEGLRDLITVG